MTSKKSTLKNKPSAAPDEQPHDITKREGMAKNLRTKDEDLLSVYWVKTPAFRQAVFNTTIA
jgi:hypothetical protein